MTNSAQRNKFNFSDLEAKPMNRLFSSTRILLIAFAMLSLIVLGTGIAQGQAISGNLTGTVTDASGAAVNGATVEAVNLGTGQKLTATTRGSGEYVFTNLPVGTYRITVTSANFRTTTLENVPVELEQHPHRKRAVAGWHQRDHGRSFRCRPAGRHRDGATTDHLRQSAVAGFGLDLHRRHWSGCSEPLDVESRRNQCQRHGPWDGSVGRRTAPARQQLQVEGVDNNNKTVTGALISVPPEAVENFTLISNQFNSDFGHSSGGQFSTTVKSGTNSFHGSLYEYFRNRNLNAVDETWVQQGLTSNPRLDNNRFGGTFGGPIIKNKLFFFTNFERNPIGYISVGGGAVAAPTAAGLAAIATDPGLSQNNFSIFKQYVPVPGAADRVHPVQRNAQTALQFSTFNAPANGTCAAGNVEVGNVSIVPATWQSWTNYVQSVDYNMSEKDQFRFRYIYNKQNELDNNAQLAAFFTPLPITYELANYQRIPHLLAHCHQ